MLVLNPPWIHLFLCTLIFLYIPGPPCCSMIIPNYCPILGPFICYSSFLESFSPWYHLFLQMYFDQDSFLVYKIITASLNSYLTPFLHFFYSTSCITCCDIVSNFLYVRARILFSALFLSRIEPAVYLMVNKCTYLLIEKKKTRMS